MISPFCPKCKYKISNEKVCPVCSTEINTVNQDEVKHEVDNKIYDVHFGQRLKEKPKIKKENKYNNVKALIAVTLILIVLLIIYIINL